MKTRIKEPFLLPVLMLALGLIAAVPVGAQTFTNLQNFNGTAGSAPRSPLVLAGNMFYGTTYQGGTGSSGTVFGIRTNGTGFTNLYNFTALSGPASTNRDGGFPLSGLVSSGSTLYGTASLGGYSGTGAIFALNTNGTGFTNLYSFTATAGNLASNSDGANPYGALILSGNTLYGTARLGGVHGVGTVFALNINGTGFTNLYEFTALNTSSGTNVDGARPRGTLVLSGKTLYGTTGVGGSADNGTLFAIGTNGLGFTNIHSFTALAGFQFLNNDGAVPWAGLIASGNTLYGTASEGGTAGRGTVFAINTNGLGFTNLYSFTSGDGNDPIGGLVLSGSTLYGTTQLGGSAANGTVFALGTNGVGFTNLYGFSTGSPNNDGAAPLAGLAVLGNTLYGTCSSGGTSGNGTIFGLSLGAVVSVSSPQLTLIPSGTNVILKWSTNLAGYTLAYTTNLNSTVVWTTVSPGPVVVNGQNTVTNGITGTRKFYHLLSF